MRTYQYLYEGYTEFREGFLEVHDTIFRFPAGLAQSGKGIMIPKLIPGFCCLD